MKCEVNTSLPVAFEKVEEIADSRFTKVRIWLAHTGKNLNGSIFSKEVLDKMASNSLANIPILGYIELDEYNKADFKGHEMKLVVTRDDMEIVYMGKAIGLIPETNNYSFEMRDGKEWLVCEGMLWNKFSEAITIFERDGAKAQSMELEPTSIAGTFNRNGDFVFTDAKFEGATCLGSGISPAMHGSTIEAQFNVSTIKQQLQEMLSELQAYQKGSDKVEDLEVKEVSEVEVTQVEQTEAVTTVETEVAPVVDEVQTLDVVADIPEETPVVEEVVATVVETFSLEEKEALENTVALLQTQMWQHETELNELRAYKTDKLKEEYNYALDELFVEFSTELSEDEIAQVRADVADTPVEEVRESLFALVGKKKAKFTATPKKQSLRVPLGGGEDVSTNVGGKSWGHLVVETVGKR